MENSAIRRARRALANINNLDAAKRRALSARMDKVEQGINDRNVRIAEVAKRIAARRAAR